MIDLHTHSTCSDGSDTYIEILRKAESIGIDYISITDHDNCRVYEEIEKDDIRKYYSGKMICGVEIYPLNFVYNKNISLSNFK